MKIVTANRLSDGRVVYLGPDRQPVDTLADAALLDDAEAELALAGAAARPGLFVGPYLFEVTPDRTPSGRDRLTQAIRAGGPTVGNSLREPA